MNAAASKTEGIAKQEVPEKILSALTECVRQRKKNGKYVSGHMDEPPKLDIS